MSDERAKALALETLAVHAGRAPNPGTGGLSPALELSTTFARDDRGELIGDFLYGRTNNPNRASLEAALTLLEGAADAACFASGSAAANALFQAIPPGSTVLLPRDLYHGTRATLETVFDAGRLVVAAVDTSDLGALAESLEAIRPALLFVETPSNPMLHVTDIASTAALAHQHGALCVADNTWATPCLTRPLSLGCDLVLHSTTKYVAGHGDVTGGALLTARADSELWTRLRQIQILAGAVPSPFDCWLTLRGLSTLALRVRAQCDNAEVVARALHAHPAVAQVLYPGLEDHPGHKLATSQMTRPGAMLSFRVKGGEEAAARVFGSLRLIERATSLGSVHSLVEHRYKVEGPNTKTPRDLLRLSIGIEAAEDLVADLEEALDAVEGS